MLLMISQPLPDGNKGLPAESGSPGRKEDQVASEEALFPAGCSTPVCACR